ncbi:MAG: hypothetical protein J7621_08145 [Niastella sp.]|nr:hypothetical protein [Niastella sp.]
MKNRIRAIYCFFVLQMIVLLSSGQETPYNPARSYSADQLKADLQFLNTKLDSIHPNLYHYTTKDKFNSFLDSLNRAIIGPMQEQEFLGLISLLNEKICDGHTMLLPSEQSMAYNGTQGRFLPFSVVYIKGKLYITENNSTDNSIQPGAIITSINGKETSAIVAQLLKRQIRDGRNQTYPLWILNHYFGAYYSYAFGQSATFSMDLTGSDGKLIHKEVAALTRDSIRLLRQQKQSVQTGEARGIILEEKPATKTAVLTIKSFDTSLLQSVYKQSFQPVTDSVFRQLKLHGIRSLLLDLRDNQGGDFEPGRQLLSYLITAPTSYLLGGKEAKLLQPQSNHFSGSLFVLINGGSFSNSAIVSACLENRKQTTFIGEESGGNKFLIFGEATDVVLPHTKIQAYISTETFRINRQSGDHGIIPRHVVQPSITDLLRGNDPVKALALKLMTGQEK